MALQFSGNFFSFWVKILALKLVITSDSETIRSSFRNTWFTSWFFLNPNRKYLYVPLEGRMDAKSNFEVIKRRICMFLDLSSLFLTLFQQKKVESIKTRQGEGGREGTQNFEKFQFRCMMRIRYSLSSENNELVFWSRCEGLQFL